eukprot:TRINITY_DN2087_c0_g2_i25.p1 TRINITY_DN2087_c0_g2~~TRINITY_DN2087_c0_g2_i25.p1  ORF type:complete len:310 (-),score=57.22 TRINITY_DN2087_c0_g2_i25:89-1018(-)
MQYCTFLPTSYSALNQKLAFIEDIGLNAVGDAFLDPSFVLLNEITWVLGKNSADVNLVKCIADFFHVHDREEDLLLWSITNEFAMNEEEFTGLFRRGSFATQMLFRLFFDELGMEYIARSVLPVIRTVQGMKDDQLELTPNGITVSVEEATRNLQFILSAVAELFKLLIREIAFCPSSIRRGFIHMKEVATLKSPELKETAVPVCFFLHFLSPALLQPEEFGLVKEKPSTSSWKAFVIISKILQSIANGILRNNITCYEPHNEIIISFLTTHVQSMRNFTNTLTDPQQIREHATGHVPVTLSRFLHTNS